MLFGGIQFLLLSIISEGFIHAIVQSVFLSLLLIIFHYMNPYPFGQTSGFSLSASVMNSTAVTILELEFCECALFITFREIDKSGLARHQSGMCLVSWSRRWFSEVVLVYYTLTSNLLMFQALHALTNTWCDHSLLTLHALMNGKWCFVTIICVLVMLRTFSCAYWPFLFLLQTCYFKSLALSSKHCKLFMIFLLCSGD